HSDYDHCLHFVQFSHWNSQVLLSFPTRRSSDLFLGVAVVVVRITRFFQGDAILAIRPLREVLKLAALAAERPPRRIDRLFPAEQDRKSTRLNSSHDQISYAVFCLKKKRLSDTTL